MSFALPPHRLVSQGINGMYTKVLATIFGMFTIFMTIIGADAERAAIKAIHREPVAYSSAGEEPKEAKAEGIIRDRFLMFLVGGGSFGGAVVCVLLWLTTTQSERKRMIAAKGIPVDETGFRSIAGYFTVSLLTAIFLTPVVLKRWLNHEPEECFAVSFMMAVSAWVLWGIAHAIGRRFLKAAEDRGIGGLKDEVLGGRSTTSVMQPSPGIQPMVGLADKSNQKGKPSS